jgi:hypothetical protein
MRAFLYPFGSQAYGEAKLHCPLALRPSLAAGLPLSRMKTQQARCAQQLLSESSMRKTERFLRREVVPAAPAALTLKKLATTCCLSLHLKLMSVSSDVKNFRGNWS